MKKNMVKAVAMVVLGATISFAAIVGVMAMFLSGDFLPTYVGNTYVVGNQIVRYALYASLVVISGFSALVAACGVKYLNKKFRKIRRR